MQDSESTKSVLNEYFDPLEHVFLVNRILKRREKNSKKKNKKQTDTVEQKTIYHDKLGLPEIQSSDLISLRYWRPRNQYCLFLVRRQKGGRGEKLSEKLQVASEDFNLCPYSGDFDKNNGIIFMSTDAWELQKQNN